MNGCKQEGSPIVFENGTVIGAITEIHGNRATKYAGEKNRLIIPEIVISASYSNNSLNLSHSDMFVDSELPSTITNASPAMKFLTNQATINTKSNSSNNEENDTVAESTALLDAHSDEEHDIAIDVQTIASADAQKQQQQQHQQQQQQPEQQHQTAQKHSQSDEFEQFVLNRSTSESNVLDSSVYSELQFPPSASSFVSTTPQHHHYRQHKKQQQQQQQQQLTTSQVSTTSTPPPPTPTIATETVSSSLPLSNTSVDVLNSSACSRESRQNKRTRRKHKSKSKCNGTTTTVTAQHATSTGVVMAHGTYPPQYTALFLDPHMQHHHHHHHHGAANAMGQITNAVAPARYLTPTNDVTANNYLQQQFQYYQQRPMMTSVGHFSHHRTLLEAVPNDVTSAITTTNTTTGANSISGTTRSFLAASSPFRVCFRKWFSRPSLPFVIGVLALGGVACTLGGIVLGSTGLVEHSTQYLSAALLMIGIGVSLLVISGAIWRLSLPDDVDECPCYRHMEACRNCNSPYCNNRLLPGSYLYPEFQHRPPPPSYLTSLNECAAMGFLFHPAAQAQQAVYSHPLQRINTPPPLYRSTNSLSVVMPPPNTTPIGPSSANTLLTTHNGAAGIPNSADSILSSQNVITMSAVMENIQAQTQRFTKEINYLDLD